MTYFIKENDETSLLNKLFMRLKKEGNELILPINVNEFYQKNRNKRIFEFYINRLMLKIKKNIENNNAILSKNIKINKEFVEELFKYNINICDGKILYRYILSELLEYILSIKKDVKENVELSFMINYMDDAIKKIIKIFAIEYKRINIITNHIGKFRKLEEELYNENGIIITVTNNKRKSLLKAKYIVNIDFPNELINKYNINENAIILSIENDVKIFRKRFCGTVINNYDIVSFHNCDYEEYDEKDILESRIYTNESFEKVRHYIENENYKIYSISGKYGTIEQL